jgi:hypothetical protein
MMSLVLLMTLAAGGTPTLSVLIVGAVNSTVDGKVPPQFSVVPLCEHCAAAGVGDPHSAQMETASATNSAGTALGTRAAKQQRPQFRWRKKQTEFVIADANASSA